MKNTLLWIAVAGLLAGARSLHAADERPNVLLVMTDDQGYGDFSLHGNPTLTTPHIDELGRQSVRFERFYVNAFCAPTRAALLTGRYPLRGGVFGVTHSKETMRASEVTLAEMLSQAGYRTGCFGKWHNGEQFPYTPPGQGFDEFLGFHNGHFNDYFDAELLRGAAPQPTTGYISDVLTDEAIRFVSAAGGQPFFCYLAFNAPHSPFQVPDKYFDKYKAKGLDDPLAAFFGMCENVDDNVGRLLAKLDELKLAENTIVIFLTDNGGTAGVKHFNAGMRGGKTSVHEGGSRVPLFVRWPAGLKQPRVVSHIAAHIDVVPTVLDLCGLAQPSGVKLDGTSLRPLLTAEGKGWPERTLFLHQPIDETNRYPGAVRTQRWRLVRELRGQGPQGGSKAKADRPPTAWQLYDMQADPGQTKDLAAEMPDLVSDLSRQYEAWLDDVSSAGLARPPIQVGHAEENPVALHAPQSFHTGSLRFYAGPGYAHDWLTGWSDAKSQVTFEIDVVRAGDYDLALRYTCPVGNAGSRMKVSVAGMANEIVVPAFEPKEIPLAHRDAAGQTRYVNRHWGTLPVGRFALDKGPAKLTIECLELKGKQALDLKGAVLQLR